MIKLNGHEIKFTKFPNNETSFEITENIINSDSGLGIKDSNLITFKYENDSCLLKLMMVKKEIDYRSCGDTYLVIFYMPYSRLDRRKDSIAFTLKSICDMINQMNFKHVLVTEAHSDVCIALLNKCTNVPFTKHLFEIALKRNLIDFDPKEDFVCFPDAGAQKNYSDIGDYNTCVGLKSRDFKTGRIKNLDIFIPGNDDPKCGKITKESVSGKNVVIVDDLCSKAGTFMLTSKKLKQLGANNISLVITHCEKTILLGDIFKTDYIDKIITSNTIIEIKDVSNEKKIHVFDVEKLLTQLD